MSFFYAFINFISACKRTTKQKFPGVQNDLNIGVQYPHIINIIILTIIIIMIILFQKLLVYIGYYHIVFMFRLSSCSGDLVHQVWVVHWWEPWLCGLGFKWAVKNGWWIGFLPGISSHFCRINCSINSFCSLSTFCKASCCTRNLIIKWKENKMLLMIWTKL